MYEDKLGGRITADMYDWKAGECTSRSLEVLRRINEIRISEPAPVQECIDLMDLTSRAADLFRVQPPKENV